MADHAPESPSPVQQIRNLIQQPRCHFCGRAGGVDNPDAFRIFLRETAERCIDIGMILLVAAANSVRPVGIAQLSTAYEIRDPKDSAEGLVSPPIQHQRGGDYYIYCKNSISAHSLVRVSSGRVGVLAKALGLDTPSAALAPIP